MRPIIALRHTGPYSWFAEAANTRARQFFSEHASTGSIRENRVPVLRDWEELPGGFDWISAPPTYREDGSGVDGHWWASPKHRDWLTNLTDRSIVWIRKSSGDNSVGRSKGVWRIGDVKITDKSLSLRLIERVAETKP